MTPLKVAIIGCGLIGQKRAEALTALGHKLVACGDIMYRRAWALKDKFGAPFCLAGNDRDVLCSSELYGSNIAAKPDVVIIATAHKDLAPLARAAMERGSHVLVEKPGARESAELDALEEVAAATGRLVRIGFNFQYHDAMRTARRLIQHSEIGEVRRIRARYGHGARKGYESEWRCSHKHAGGGAGIDILIHLVDLCHWFTGQDFDCRYARAYNEYWQCNVEDNAVMHLENKRCHALLTASWTEWKNVFHFEIFGETGKIEINGIGGSYGPETLTVHKMSPEMGPPVTTITQYGGDNSWKREFADFAQNVEAGRLEASNIGYTRKALKLVETLYTPDHQLTQAQQKERENFEKSRVLQDLLR